MLVDAVVSIADGPSEQAVLEGLVELGRVMCDARYAIALLLGADGSPSALAHLGMSSSEVASLPRLPGPVGLVGVVLAGETLRLARMSDHSAAVGFPARHVPMAALLGVPIVLDGRVLGGLYLTRAPGEGTFTGRHERLAAALARQAAVAADRLRRRAAHESVLSALGGTDLRAGEDYPHDQSSAVVQRLLAAARRALGTDLTFLSRIDDGRQTFSHVDSSATGPALSAGTTVDATDGYCQLMIDGTIASSVPDVPAHPLLGAMPVTAALQVGGYCGVPVHLPDGTLYGTLCGLDSDPGNTPSPGQLESLRTIAGLLGEALDRQQQAERARQDQRSAFWPMLDGTRRTVVLQPIMDLRRRTPVGYEALSRFSDFHGAPRRPDQVFAEASRLGLGVRLEQAAVRDALALLPDLPAGTYLSVNFSPATLLDPGTYDLLTASQLDRIVVELTEHDQIQDYPALLGALAGLRARGLRLAVDDAGSGFASLQHITRLQPDIIKLDIAFVRNVDTDPSRRAVARAMIAFAAELGASLVAEGIETAEELAQLRTLGAQLGQGYHLARPTSAQRLFPATSARPAHGGGDGSPIGAPPPHGVEWPSGVGAPREHGSRAAGSRERVAGDPDDVLWLLKDGCGLAETGLRGRSSRPGCRCGGA